MKNAPIATESFSSNRRHYFLDFNRARNNSNYIRITRSDEQADNTYKRSSVVVFESEFFFLIQAFASLFHHAGYAQDLNGDLSELRPSEEKGGGIKNWPEEMRPREKLMTHGRAAMEDAELLAMLIGSGTTEHSAVELCRQILAGVDNDLSRLAALTLDELCRFRGIGPARGLSIIAATELATRMRNARQQTLYLVK